MRMCKNCMWVYHMVAHNPIAPCENCKDYDKWQTMKQTNADRIRAMNDEELAEFLDRWALGDIDYSKTFCDLCKGQFDCHDDCLMDWLKQECE